RAGRYAEALAHRFVSLILELERRHALTFHPSKTPAEYVREARLDESGRASLADLVARLYRHLFGAVPCDANVYREFGVAAETVFRHVATASARARARARLGGGRGLRRRGSRCQRAAARFPHLLPGLRPARQSRRVRCAGAAAGPGRAAALGAL